MIAYKDFMLYFGIFTGAIFVLILLISLFVGDVLFSSEEWNNQRYLCVEDGGKWLESEKHCDCGVGRHYLNHFCQ